MAEGDRTIGEGGVLLRPYQQEAIEAVYAHLRRRDDNPCLVCPTGAGKSFLIATICRDAVEQWQGRVLVLAHVKELLEQAVEKLHAVAPDLWMQIGVYSAGLRSRDTDHPIIVAGIQSVYRRACELGPFDLLIVDEAHLIQPDGEGMYRQLLAEAKVVSPHLRVIGLTATPFRMTTGMICGPDNILNEICYEISVRELIAQGYLCPLRSKAGRTKVDTSGLHIRGGEFIASEVEALMDEEYRVRAACREIVEHTAERNAVLIFASGVRHAQHIQRVLGELNGECGLVCGDTLPFERSETLKRFRSGNLKYLVNVNVLTTGFDAPNIDCVALLRPTNSPGLFYQSVGRGFRLHPGKTDCQILDFGGNILRHGPVDCLAIKEKSNAAGDGEAPAKECPQCQAVIHAAYTVCPDCGYAFPPPQREQHDTAASTAGVLSGQVEDTEYKVLETCACVHRKRGADDDHPRTLRVEYRIGWNNYVAEWVCFEHEGYARRKAEDWWQKRSFAAVPDTAAEALELIEAGAVAQTQAVTVRSVAGEKFDRVIRHELGPIPAWREAGDDELEEEPTGGDPCPSATTFDEADLPF